jgi:hypothetical protein
MAMQLRSRICYVLSLLGIHSTDCEHCMARLTHGDELRKRLEELNGGTQLCPRENGTIESLWKEDADTKLPPSDGDDRGGTEAATTQPLYV